MSSEANFLCEMQISLSLFRATNTFWSKWRKSGAPWAAAAYVAGNKSLVQVEEPSVLIELFLATLLLLDEHSDWSKMIKRSCTPILKKIKFSILKGLTGSYQLNFCVDGWTFIYSVTIYNGQPLCFQSALTSKPHEIVSTSRRGQTCDSVQSALKARTSLVRQLLCRPASKCKDASALRPFKTNTHPRFHTDPCTLTLY